MRRLRKRFGFGNFTGIMAALPALFVKPAWGAALALKVGWVFGGLSRNAAHSLDKAILVIGLPPVFFFIALFYYIYRRRGSWRGEQDSAGTGPSDSGTPQHEAPRNRA